MSEQSDKYRCMRRGFVLPPAIIITVLIALLAGAMEFAAWRSTRAARLAWNGERALHATDEVLAATIANWNPFTFAKTSIGSRTSLATHSTNGANATVTIVHTHPLGAFIEADVSSDIYGTPRSVHRRVGRAVQLWPPPLPLIATITTLGSLLAESGTAISGVDDTTLHDECGPTRDTASIGGIAARAMHITSISSVRGAPNTQIIGDTILRTQFTAAWITLMQRSSVQAWPMAGTALGTQPPWNATIINVPTGGTLGGTSFVEGLLVINGDLTLVGTLRVRGLLVVHGALDARRGQLDIEGAVLVADVNNTGSMLGNGVAVRYSQCALRRALATVAMPITRPFAVWQER